MADSNLNKMIETALENIKKMTGANTVVGDPIKVTGGSTVIPVSKVSVGFASGGMDYNSKSAPDKAPNFGGGTGSGFTITPVAFLVIDNNGAVSLLDANFAGKGGDIVGTISGLVDKAPSMIEKIKKIFNKDKDAPETPDSENQNNSATLNNAVLENTEAKTESK